MNDPEQRQESTEPEDRLRGRGEVPIASVIVPTFQEAETIRELIDRLSSVRARSGLDLELVIVDDSSPDGTADAARAMGVPWVRVIDRRGARSLTGAVMDGFAAARSDVLVVMDADLTHPPERVPDLVGAVVDGARMAIGSRHAPGATMDAAWPLSRRIASAMGTMLVQPLVKTSDPLSGFFAVRREVIAAAGPIRTKGFKVGLELMVRAEVRRPVEVPIHFADRQRGASKASVREAARYIALVGRLYAVAAARAMGLGQSGRGRGANGRG